MAYLRKNAPADVQNNRDKICNLLKMTFTMHTLKQQFQICAKIIISC